MANLRGMAFSSGVLNWGKPQARMKTVRIAHGSQARNVEADEGGKWREGIAGRLSGMDCFSGAIANSRSPIAGMAGWPSARGSSSGVLRAIGFGCQNFSRITRAVIEQAAAIMSTSHGP